VADAPEGLAVDAEDNLWVGEAKTPGKPPFQLDQFAPAYAPLQPSAFLKTLEIEGEAVAPPFEGEPGLLAVDHSTGMFYTAAGKGAAVGSRVAAFDKAGTYVERSGSFDEVMGLAVDNSAEPSAGSVYVSHYQEDVGPPISDGLPPGVVKLDAAAEPREFSCLKEPGSTCSSYVSGHEITGTPAGPFRFGSPPASTNYLAVDSQGDIYLASDGESAVDEYRASGEFLRRFTGAGAPGHSGEVFAPGALGFDATNGDLLVVNQDVGVGVDGGIEEFDSSGRFLGQILAGPAGPLLSLGDLTLDSHGDLYAVDSERHVVDAWGPGHFVPSLRLGEATGRTQVAATLTATLNPESTLTPEPSAYGVADCHFEYLTEEQFGKEGGFSGPNVKSAPCTEPGAAQIHPNDEFQPVHAEISGLLSGTTYRYRLSATLAGALGGQAEVSPALAFTAPHQPRVESTSVGDLSSTFAGFGARIDPLGAETTYRFEYLPLAGFVADGESWAGPHIPLSVPVPDGSIGSGGANGNTVAGVSAGVGALAPGTAYVFRVVASNALGSTPGANVTFTTLAAPVLGLPDGRAYELVTPAGKGSAEDLFGEPMSNGEFANAHDDGVVSESGGQFLEETKAGFGSFPASGTGAYVFSRAPGGWSTTSLASPSLGVQSLGTGAVSGTVFEPAGFSRVAVNDRVGSQVGPAGQRIVNLTGPAGGPYTTLYEGASFSNATGKASEEAAETAVAGASHDLGHLVLQSRVRSLCPGAAGQDEGSHVLCQYSAGELTLASVDSKGKVLPCGAELGAGVDGAVFGANSLGVPSGAAHDAVSADGSRVFFTAPDPQAVNLGEGCWNGKTTNAPQLYVRSGGSTVEVSKPEPGAPEAGKRHLAEYVGASEDGSRVFLITTAQLTKDDAGIEDLELYEYDVETGKLTRVSHGQSGKAAGAVVRVVAVSGDGAAVYFMANGVLAANVGADGTHASPGDCTAGSGACGLYRYDTASATTTYIATLNSSDMQLGNRPGLGGSPAPSVDHYTTPDGGYFVFASTRELTGYSTVRASAADCRILPEAAGGNGHCVEVYRYRYEPESPSAGSLVCVSCNPTGAPPVSNARFARSAAATSASGPVRAMSNDGSYVFFDTADALVPNDTNNTLDVYEWHEGRVALLSSGKDPAPSFFLGASPDGSNVFIGTHARLVPRQDTDDQGDIYDARVCTTTDPCLKPPEPETPLCEGSSCQSAPAQPAEVSLPSLVFSGAANILNTPMPPPPAKKSAAQIRTEKLTKAVASCRKKYKHSKKRRATCEKQAHRAYAAAAKKATNNGRTK